MKNNLQDEEMKAQNPFAQFTSNVFLDGIPIPLSSLPPELQEIAKTIWTMEKKITGQ